MAVIGLVIAGIIVSKLIQPDTTPDAVQIQNALQTAANAADEKDAPKLMSIVSDNYSDSDGNNREELSLLLSRAMSNVGNIDVSLGPVNVTVNGDLAVSTGNIIVSTDGQRQFSQLVTVNWQKEETRRYLVIPDKTWRVIRSSYTGNMGAD